MFKLKINLGDNFLAIFLRIIRYIFIVYFGISFIIAVFYRYPIGTIVVFALITGVAGFFEYRSVHKSKDKPSPPPANDLTVHTPVEPM